jgi:peptidoglycan/xylan/chitin deacetylase (PgdA/CDA1 family)
MKHGRLVISLDFELLWGVFDKIDYNKKVDYFKNTRRVVPKLIKLFEDYDIHATWATVGMLFNENWEQWIENVPRELPAYNSSKLSAYQFGLNNKDLIKNELCFAHDIIDIIHMSKGQEMATHTYSHYYCLENGQTVNSFHSDLKKAIQLAENKGIQLKSLVFPRNQFNPEYLKICKELGITGVRINPDNWYWDNTQKDTLLQKVFRTGDAYLGLMDKTYDISTMNRDLPVQQRASRLLRPKESEFKNNLKLKRIFDEMQFAAKNKNIYHLWWHPHNFGKDPEGNLNDLKLILECYKKCQKNYGLVSNSMSEISHMVISGSN